MAVTIDVENLLVELQDEIDQTTFAFLTERLWPLADQILRDTGYDTELDNDHYVESVEKIARGIFDGIATQVKV